MCSGRVNCDSAQMAAPRTSGDASSSKASQAGANARSSLLLSSDQHIAQEPVPADALDRRAGEERPEGCIIHGEKPGQ